MDILKDLNESPAASVCVGGVYPAASVCVGGGKIYIGACGKLRCGAPIQDLVRYGKEQRQGLRELSRCVSNLEMDSLALGPDRLGQGLALKEHLERGQADEAQLQLAHVFIHARQPRRCRPQTQVHQHHPAQNALPSDRTASSLALIKAVRAASS
jgi:hypothetical protein